MKLVRSTLVIGLAALPAIAMAMPPFLKTFTDTYKDKVPANSAVAKSSCSTCHVGASTKLNPYGVDLKKAMATLKTRSVTPAALAKIEALDSDKDGVTNIDEIKKGTLPGDAKSK